MTQFSHSRISTFENCALQYRYRYIDKIRTEGLQGIEAFLGKRVHETLEQVYKDVQHAKVPTLDEILDNFNARWEREWSGSVEIVKDRYTAEDYKAMGIKHLTDYYKHYAPFNQDRTIGIEQYVTIKIDGYSLRGYIDRLSEKDGVYRIHDYKTSQTLPSQAKLDQDRQLALYALAIKEHYADAKEVELIWHYLAFDKELHSKRTDDDLEMLKGSILQSIATIKQAEEKGEFPHHESALCSWCEYQPLCPAWKHIYETEKLDSDKFHNDNGVRLVNSYAALKTQLDAYRGSIQPELEKVEQAIVEYAKKHKVETINGSDVTVRVKIEDTIGFPKSGDAKRVELEAKLKELGKWDEVLRLDTGALKKIVREKSWDAATLQVLAQYVDQKESSRVYLSSK